MIFQKKCSIRPQNRSITVESRKEEVTIVEDGQIVGLFWARSEEALRAVDETYGGCAAVLRSTS